MYYQQGGQQDQIMQLIQAYAQINKIDPSQLMQQLQQMPAEQQQEAIQQMAESLQQSSEQPDMTQAAMAYGGYTTGVFADGGEIIRRADGSYSKRGLWDNVRANKGSGKKPTKQMLEQEKKIRAQEAAYGGMFANGGTNNAGFNALPDYVQAKILSNMGYGGYYDPMQLMDEGGEPNGGMALGQMSAVADKMSKLRQFVSPEQNLDPWIASKLAVMDHSADAISDYMMYNTEAKGEEMEMEEQEMRRGGSTFSGNAWYQEGGSSVAPLVPYNKEYMDALGKEYKNFYSNKPPFLPVPKNDDGFDAFYHSKYDPLPNTKRTASGWITTLKNAQPEDGVEFTEDDGETMAPKARKNTTVKRVENYEVVERPSSDYSRITRHLQDRFYKPGMNFLNFYQDGGEPRMEDYPDYGSYRADLLRYNAGQMNTQAAAAQQAPMQQTSMQEEPKVMWHPEWEEQGIDPMTQSSAPKKAAATPINYSGVSIVDLLSSAGKASDYNSRKQLAAQLGIDNYYGSAKQNLELIKKVTSNPDSLNDYKPVAKPRSGSTTVTKLQGNNIVTTTNSNGVVTKKETVDPVSQNLNELKQSNALDAIFAQQKKAYLAANPGMTEQQYEAAMAANRPKQSFIGPASKPLPYRSGSDPYDDSYMLNKIANDPETPGNVRARKQKEFARNMGLTALSAIPFLSWTRYYPLLRGLPEFASTMARGARALPGGAKALPQAGRALPKPAPTNWVTNSGLSFKEGGINLDPAKKGTFKAQATRMGMGVQEAASAILNAPEGKYSPAMRKKANFAKNFAKQMGGPVEGEVMDVSPEQLEALRQQGYEFEIM
jgi:hypothetical protein